MRTAALIVWSVLAASGLALQATGLLTRHRFPTVLDAAGAAMSSWYGRVVVLTGWTWMGWHVFVRSTPG